VLIRKRGGAMMRDEREPVDGGFVIGPWQDERTTITATGTTTANAVNAGLSGVLAVYRGEIEATGADDATTALPLRAEASDLAGLFTSLAASLMDEIDHDAYDVRGVRFDGMVRTDDGLAGWGYALAVPEGHRRSPLAIKDVEVFDEGGTFTLRARLRRGEPVSGTG
jgi:hypothetical protein